MITASFITAVLLSAAPEEPAQTDTSTRTYTLTSTLSVAHQPKIYIDGNRVLPAQVYRVLLDPPDRWPPSEYAIAKMTVRLKKFLNAAGYEIARVKLHVKGDDLTAEIDEGRLERITFPGQSGLGALRLQLALDLPGDVFNRPQLDEQLHKFETDHGIDVIEYKLVPVDGDIGAGAVQLSELGEIRGVPIIPDVGRYELQVFVAEKDLPAGVHLELEGKSGDGFRTRFKYRSEGLLLEDERWEIGAEIGLRVQDLLKGGNGRTFVSRGGGGLRWYSPRLSGGPLRLIVQPEVTWLSRQRLDLGIKRYDVLLVEPTAVLSYRVTHVLNLSLGGGVEYQRLIKLRRDPDSPGELIPPDGDVHPLVLANARLEFGRQSTRLDRLHEVELALRSRVGTKSRVQNRVSLGYATTYSFGFDDLELRASGTSIFGQVPFTDEERFGDRLRGLFTDQNFCSKAASVGVEYRLSLAREMYKISGFHDGAVCSPETLNGPIWGNAFGVGFHALILDTFRLSLRIAQGFASVRRNAQGVSISLNQVF